MYLFELDGQLNIGTDVDPIWDQEKITRNTV